MALSVMVAIVLTPALCATLLKPLKKGEHHGERGFFKWFNTRLEQGNKRYRGVVRGMLNRSLRFLAIYLALAVFGAYMFFRLPSSFLPDEDQGVLFTIVQAPDGATQQRTQKVLEQVERFYLEDEAEHMISVFTVQGFSFAGSGQNNGIAFVNLKEWDERTSEEASVDALVGRALGTLGQIKDAFVFTLAPPPVPELGATGGFNLYLQDRGGHGHDALMAARNQLLGMAAQSPLLIQVRPNGQEDAPQFRVEVDTARAAALGVSIAEINSTLSLAWGGRYVDDFIDRGRVKRGYVQADAPYRMVPEDFNKWYVRNNAGEMVPFTAFASTRWEYGSPRLERYNGVPAINITGMPAPGVSSGDAMAEDRKGVV